MKRAFDFFAAAAGLTVMSPILIASLIAVWLQDYNAPLYIAPRVGRDGRIFRMVKLRSMVRNADKSGVDSTAAGDMRITPVGRLIRRYKLDEITQLWNVLTGDMSLVGPRPNVKRETDLYTPVERGLLDMRPGITDFASIVFADEGEILSKHDDPDIAYNQLIRPGKSRLGLFYIRHAAFLLDIELILLTLLAIVRREKALRYLSAMLERLGAEPDLVVLARREQPLYPAPPPGADFIVTARLAG